MNDIAESRIRSASNVAAAFAVVGSALSYTIERQRDIEILAGSFPSNPRNDVRLRRLKRLSTQGVRSVEWYLVELNNRRANGWGSSRSRLMSAAARIRLVFGHS
jgi:hypothetical protein